MKKYKRKREKFFGCSICPNKVFPTSRMANEHKILVHKLGYGSADLNKETSVHSILKSKKPVYFSNSCPSSSTDNFSQSQGEKLSNKKKKELIGSTTLRTSKNLKVDIPDVNTLLKNSILSQKWICNLCSDYAFNTEYAAMEHVELKHQSLKPQDLISDNGGKRYKCKVCKMPLKNKIVAENHYMRHIYLFARQTELRGEVKKSVLVSGQYYCTMCKLFGTAKLLRMHVWEKHNKEARKCKNQPTAFTECTRSDVQFEQGISKFVTSQNISETRDYLITKDLMRTVGITELSETSAPRLWIMKREIPDKLYSCCLCPHLTLLSEQINAHKRFHETQTNDIIAPVPIEAVTEQRFVENGYDIAIISCICQHSKINRDALKTQVLADTYNKMVKEYNLSEDYYEVDSETKLTRIYDYQFFEHNKHRLSYKIPDAASDSRYLIALQKNYIGNISTVEIENVRTGQNLIVMRNLLKQISIDKNSKSSGLQRKFVEKPPDMVYSCFLCPHVSLFSPFIVNHHFAKHHDLIDNYQPFISAVPMATLVEHVRSKQHFDSMLVPCICQYTTFKSSVMSTPIIESQFKTASDLLRMYKRSFKCHNTYNLIIKTKMPRTKRELYKNEKIPTTIRTLRFHEIKEVHSTDVRLRLDTDRGIQIEPAYNDNIQEIAPERTIFFRDILKKVKMRYGDIPTQKYDQLPSTTYCCCLCPHKPMFHPNNVKAHIVDKHKVTNDHTALVCTIPTDTLLDKSVDNNDIYTYLNCPCQYISFSSTLYSKPPIHDLYRELVTKNYDSDRDVDIKTKLISIYCNQKCPKKYRLLIGGGIKRPLEPGSEVTTRNKVPRLHEEHKTVSQQNREERSQIPEIFTDVTPNENDTRNQVNDSDSTADMVPDGDDAFIDFTSMEGFIVVDEENSDEEVDDDDDDDTPLKLTF